MALGLTAAVALWLSSIGAARQAKADLKTARSQSYMQGQADQHKIDELAAQKAAASPFRSYVAPDAFGAFELKFPRNWSLYVVENATSTNQLSLTLHPDQIRVLTNHDNVYAARVILTRNNLDTVTKQYQDKVKAGRLSSRKVVVSAIESTRLDGKIDDKHTGTVVLVPVRDKTLIFINDDQRFSKEFDQVLAQSKILP